MGMADDIKRLGEEIATSYDMRVKAIGELGNNVSNMMKTFQKEHKEMADKLRENLKKDERDRLEESSKRNKERKAEVAGLLKSYRDEREKLAANWQAVVDTMAKKKALSR